MSNSLTTHQGREPLITKMLEFECWNFDLENERELHLVVFNVPGADFDS